MDAFMARAVQLAVHNVADGGEPTRRKVSVFH